MRTIRKCGALALLLTTACVWAQPGGSGHGAHSAAPQRAGAEVEGDWNEGEVRRVDTESGRISLRHGYIKSLDMPPMTMVFTVRDKALLDKTSVGAKVRIQVVSENGQMVVTELQPAP